MVLAIRLYLVCSQSPLLPLSLHNRPPPLSILTNLLYLSGAWHGPRRVLLTGSAVCGELCSPSGEEEDLLCSNSLLEALRLESAGSEWIM